MKEWWKSKTVWVQILTVAIAILTAIAGHEMIADNPALVSGLLLVLAVVNAVLRWLTDQRITSFAPTLDKFRSPPRQ